MRTKSLILSILLTSLIVCSGCYDSIEVDDQTYIIAMGFDKGKVEPLKMTLQYANATAINSGGSNGGGGSSSGNVVNVSAEATTIAGGINQMNSYIGKQIDVSHALLLVFSEAYAKQGIAEYLRGITRNRDFRPTMYIAICRGSAEDYLNAIKPIQETDPSKYYQLLYSKFNTTGYSIDSNIYKFYNAMESSAVQSTANLVGVNKYTSTKEFTEDASTYKNKGHMIPFEGDFKAGDLPRIGDQKGELMGLAVFNGDKLVGELDGEASMNYQMITGEFNIATLTIPDPMVPGKYVILNIKQSRRPVSTVDISSSSPKIHTKIQIEGDITIIQSGYNYESTKNLPILDEAIAAFLKKDIEYLVNKTIKDYKSDIFGFGKVVKKQFLTIDKWEAYDWLNKYKNATFSVDVDMKIRRPGLKLRSSQIKSSNGEGESQ